MVSTIFLGFDHGFGMFLDEHDPAKPVLWETMVFGLGDHRPDQRRYTSRAEALAGHDEMVAWAESLRPKKPRARK